MWLLYFSRRQALPSIFKIRYITIFRFLLIFFVLLLQFLLLPTFVESISFGRFFFFFGFVALFFFNVQLFHDVSHDYWLLLKNYRVVFLLLLLLLSSTHPYSAAGWWMWIESLFFGRFAFFLLADFMQCDFNETLKNIVWQ